MLINANEINKVLSISGNQVTARGKKYFEQSRVKIGDFSYIDDDNYVSKSYVEGKYIYDVLISKENSKLKYVCNCPASTSRDTPCKHIIATIFNMYINESDYTSFKKDENVNIDKNKLYNIYTKKIKDEISNTSIIKYYEDLEIYQNSRNENINVVPVLDFLSYPLELNVSFKIGKDKMYKLKDLIKFYECFKANENYKYGKDLEFIHTLKNFNPNSISLVKFIVKRISEYYNYSKMGSYYFNLPNKYKGVMKLNYGALDDFFDIYNSQKVIIENYNYESSYGMVTFTDENPNFVFDVQEVKEGIELSLFCDDYYTFEGQDYVYVLYKDKLYRCTKEFKDSVYPLLKELKKKSENTLFIPLNDCTSLCEYVIPKISKTCNVNIDNKITEKYKPEELVIKTFLDLDENLDVTCDVKFCYGKNEINPFASITKDNCNRNVLKEKKAKQIFRNNNFIINTKKSNLYLNNERDIYDFLVDGIETFNLNFDVYITDRLKKRQIMHPRGFNVGVKVNNEFLNLDISNLEFSEEDLKEIFKAYKLKKKYYRLKKGSFVDLESKGIVSLINLTNYLNISKEDIAKKQVQVPKYRALYLDKLANSGSIELSKDEKFDTIIDNITNSENLDFAIPTNFNGSLRLYQKTGFSWLKTLDKYNFGGILADDMGLGKTIQIIALLLDEKNINDKSISIVVCPSSLYLNWEREISKFAPDLKVVVINGNVEQREEKIKNIQNFNVVITSYDLLKRDIERYADYNFRYIIADEAQYIKNNNTKNSKMLKKLKGVTKFALTGTPIENSLSELWSIFDFCIPGYLYTYPKFKEDYEVPIIKDENVPLMERLRQQVSPFILRRIKKDVLKELPDKTETIMYSDMETEQRKVYESYLLKAKEDMDSSINSLGFEKSKLKILSLITRLRQICCHPSLFVSNYDGNSAKLTQCLDILKDAISSGHKVLLFSQFTSMLDILKTELDKNDIKYMELTGKTKSDDRLDMVNSFNTQKEIQVFLISLKAGGTGLNLVGADVVIHFDPWWNLSVQNQATDRAHRIGQKKNVQVFKLITENSIEEKIEKLQERKINMANNIVKEGENFITKMSKEDILSLFE